MDTNNANMCPIKLNFAVPYFDIFDPRFPDHGVPVAVRGNVSFIMQNGRASYDMQDQIRAAAVRYIKDLVANIPADYGIPVLQIERRIGLISKEAEALLKQRLLADFGVTVTGVDLNAIEIDRACEEYELLMAVSRDVLSERALADSENYAERLRIDREEEQYARRMKTRSENLEAYRSELQAQIAMTPPPVPAISYHVAIDGQDVGVFNAEGLYALKKEGKFNANTLVWKPGMAEWMPAEDVQELKRYVK